jgi:hypothetical protein
VLGLPAAASATTVEMRGEWEVSINSSVVSTKGKALITEEANGKGEFASHSLRFESGVGGIFSGTLEGAKASVTVTSEGSGPFPPATFTSTGMTVEPSGIPPSMSGSGTLTFGSSQVPATLTATRIRTYQQVKEQEEREKREQEEREARENVRGEWELAITAGPQTSHGTALITQSANSKDEFGGSALFEGQIPGSFTGTLAGAKASVKITTQAAGPVPASEFTSTEIAVESTTNPHSMSGTGMLTFGQTTIPATLTATRIKTYAQVLQQEKEALEKEVLEREAREAKERAEREAREKTEREARERTEREAREKAEREAAQSHTGSTPPIMSGGSTSTGPPVSVQLAAKTFTAGSALSLRLTNPNDFAVQGHVTLSIAPGAGKAAASKKKPTSLGTASFSLSPHGTALVKITLSRSGRAELARRHTLHVIASIATTASGQPSASKSYKITLHAATHQHG